jgi:arylsulfatase A-like enzyme
MNRTRWAWRFDTPEKYQAMVKGYYRMISGVDMVLGRIVAELERRGLARNTIIVYASDNGYFLGERGYAGKWLMYDLSINVPLIVLDPRAPRGDRGLVRRELVLNVDLPATFLDLAGAPIPEVIQGRSLRPLLGRSRPAWRGEIFCEELLDNPEIPQSECVRTDRWKYIQYPRHPEYVELFDLEEDPQEKRNLAGDNAQRARLEDLRERCRKWIERLVAERKRFQ